MKDIKNFKIGLSKILRSYVSKDFFNIIVNLVTILIVWHKSDEMTNVLIFFAINFSAHAIYCCGSLSNYIETTRHLKTMYNDGSKLYVHKEYMILKNGEPGMFGSNVYDSIKENLPNNPNACKYWAKWAEKLFGYFEKYPFLNRLIVDNKLEFPPISNTNYYEQAAKDHVKRLGQLDLLIGLVLMLNKD